MAVTYKDIDQLSQKSSVAGTEKLPVSDTQYITPSQIVPKTTVDGYPCTEMFGIYDPAMGNAYALPGSELEEEDDPDVIVLADNANVVHKTGDETIADDKTFTDNIGVVDADHIVYSGGGGGGGFTKGVTSTISTSTTNISFSVSGEPKAFVMSFRNANAATASTAYIIAVVGDSTGTHAVYTTGTQNNYSSGFTTSYSNGYFTITAPTGISFPGGGMSYSLVYYYGSGTLTFKTAQVQPGSGATSVTFTDANLTEMPEMYATILESQVNNESYRRVSLYTNAGSDGLGDQQALGVSFYSSNIYDTTSSFTATYQTGYSAGLNINSGGTNAGGYFHNPGTYTLYYLMASDVGSGGGGGFQSLGDELDDIRDTIGDIETLLAAI